jgi:anti-sigma factor RsiW
VLDCKTTLDLIPAMLLDALDADETLAVQAHLRDCSNCRAEADALRPVVGAMGLAAPDAGAPSPKVKQRLMEQISVRPKPVAQPRRWFFRPLAVFATAAAVLAIAFGVWGFSQQAQLTQQQVRLNRLVQQQTALTQFMLDDQLRPVPVKFEGQTSAAAVLYVASDQVAMAVSGLPALTGDEVYQCWWESGQDWVAGSTFKVDAQGAGVWAWKRPAGGEYTQMVITREAQAGLDKHSGPLILTANLQ